MSDTCYMCCARATGTEHVPPRCLFPEQKDLPNRDLRKNLIRVPSCDAHNSVKSKEDEYLLFVLIIHFENNELAKRQFTTKVIRALKRRPHLVSIYKGTTKEVFLNGSRTLAFQFNRKRIDEELDHIARGLYFGEFKTKWEKRIAIHSPAMLALEGADAESINATTQYMAKLASVFFTGAAKIGDNPEVFWYQMHAEPQNERLIVLMCFYQGLEVIAFSDPRIRQNAEQFIPAGC